LTCASTGTGNHTLRLENAENLVSGNDLYLGNAVGVTEDFTDPVLSMSISLHAPLKVLLLGGSGALLRKLGDLLDDLLGSGLEPRRGSTRVGDGRSRYSLSVAVKTTHCSGCEATVEGDEMGWRMES
jgi:hypothetical protein